MMKLVGTLLAVLVAPFAVLLLAALVTGSGDLGSVELTFIPVTWIALALALLVAWRRRVTRG